MMIVVMGKRGLFALMLALLVGPLLAQQSPRQPIVYVAAIEGPVDMGLAPFVQRVLDEAKAAEAAAVVLKINTFGGRVDAAVQIRDALLASSVRTVAFIDKRAISAGALISLACNSILMSGGSTIGAATPMQAGQGGAAAQPAGEKAVSYVRKEFRATAESRGRPLLIAEAMVDADVAIPDVVEKGKLLTLTTEEAIKHRLADARVDTLEAVLQHEGLAGAEIRSTTPNWAERLVRLLTEPLVSSLLITLATLGLVVELRAPGFGVAGAVGLSSLALFLWGHWLVQLAGWEELLLITAGVGLLALEVFVIPGFGIAGALGILGILAGLVLSVLGPEPSGQLIAQAAVRVGTSLLIALAASIVLLRFVTRLPIGRGLVLDSGLLSAQGYTSASDADQRWLGRNGVALTPLRPAGIAEIDGQRIDVVSNGELIDASESIQVVRVDGNRIVVARLRNA